MKSVPNDPTKPNSTIRLTCQHTIYNSEPTILDIMTGVSAIRSKFNSQYNNKYSDIELHEIHLEAQQERYEGYIESYMLVFTRSVSNPNYDNEMIEYFKKLTEYHQVIEENKKERKELAKAETERLSARKAYKEQSHKDRLAKREIVEAEEMVVAEFRIKWRAKQSKKETSEQ